MPALLRTADAYDGAVVAFGRRAPMWALFAAAIAAPSIAMAVATGGAATVERAAERGSQVQIGETAPPPPGCRRVIVIGDSLTDNAEPWVRSGLQDAGHEFHVDAQPSRRIPGYVRAPYSGVRAALAARASFGDADCWMVALGSNDLLNGADDPTAASGMVDEMLGAITPGAAVWWVNVNYHRDPRTRFDFVGATSVFNTVLDSFAATRDRFTVIDWYSYSEQHLEWFFDPVHVDRTGSIARATLTVAALPPPRR
jgi:hypothetical protein